MSTSQETQTLEETLNKTDFGHMINENKKPILIIAAITVLAIIAYSVQGHLSSEKKYALLDKAFEVETTVFRPYLDGKTKGEQFVSSLNTVSPDLISHPNLVPSFIASVNKLEQESLVNANVIETAKRWQKNISKSHLLNIFLTVKVASLLEDDGKVDEAISLLESLVSSKALILKDKVHFDLGRLYLAKGDTKTAKERFDYFLNDPEKEKTEYSMLAKIYLSGL